jgi:transcriptional regulator with XRE-family HTH domain
MSVITKVSGNRNTTLCYRVRKKLGLNQEEFGLFLKKTSRSIENWEQDKDRPAPFSMLIIFDFLLKGEQDDIKRILTLRCKKENVKTSDGLKLFYLIEKLVVNKDDRLKLESMFL